MHGRPFAPLAAAVACALYAAMFVGLHWSGGWLVRPDGALAWVDFVPFYAAGHLALWGDAASAYDWPTLEAVQVSIGATGFAAYGGWLNPPTFFLVVAPLALLPYLPAFCVWMVVSSGVFGAGIWTVLPRRSAVVAAFAAPATVLCVWNGQNGFLTAGLLALWLGLLDHRPWLAGAFLGMLTYKPHLGMVFPLLLLVAGRWQTFLAATAMAVTLVIGSAAVFGANTWTAFFASITGTANRHLTTTVPDTLQSVYGVSLLASGHEASAIGLHAVVAALALLAAVTIWRSAAATSEARAVAAMAAAFLTTPYTFQYDGVALAVAATFLFRADGGGVQRALVLAAAALPALTLWIRFGLILPTAWGIMLGVAAASVWRAAPTPDRIGRTR